MNRKQLRHMIMERLSISLMEHLTKPNPGSLPLKHIEKINSLIDSGDPAMINQARSLVSALGGPPYYVDEYIDFMSVGDIEKLGSQAKDNLDTFYMENPGGRLSDDPEKLRKLSNLRDRAMSMAHQKALRDNPNPQPSTVKNPGDREYYPDSRYYQAKRAHSDRYFDILHRSPDSLFEHRIAPTLNLPGVPQSHIDKIHELIRAGELAQAQSLIDAFGGPPNYALDYIAYEEVGDLEKLGNRAADVMANVPKTERGWSTMSDMQPVYDIDKQAYDSVRRKIERGELPADITWDRDYMRDRYFSIRNRDLGGNNTFFDHREDKSPTYFDDDGNPLNEHNSSRAGLRRMILQEMSSMGIGGQPPMSIDKMMQELQLIEAQLEEMEMEREEWIANEARYTGDEVEAAYGYEMEFPDYYDEKEELQSRAYELEEMIEAAGGPTL